NDYNNTDDASDVYPKGTTTVKWTATDYSGNSSSCTQDIIISDQVSPTAVTKNITVELDGNGTASITENDVDDGSSDNCGIQTMTLSKIDFDCSYLNATKNNQSLNLTNTNNASNQKVVTSYVMTGSYTKEAWVNIRQAATSNNNFISGVNGKTSIRVAPDNQGKLGAGHSIGGWSVVSDNVAFPLNTWVHTAVTYDAATQQMKLYKNGNLVSSNISYSYGSETVQIGAWMNGYGVDGLIDDVRIWNTVRSDAEIAANMYECLSGNEPGLKILFKMEDSPGSSIVTDQAGNNNGILTNMNTTSAWDNNVPPGICTGSEVVLTVADYSGNLSTGISTVKIVDNEAPVLSCPANINVPATSVSGAAVNYTLPTATDNCAATVTLVLGPASGSTFPIGTTTVTYLATDASGNSDQCSFDVTVKGVAPVIKCVDYGVVIFNDPGLCGAIVSYYPASETTAIPASTITYSHNSGSLFPAGTTTVTATATNVIGTSSCTFDITVIDNIYPSISCPSNINVIATSAAGSIVNFSAPVGIDNCTATTRMIAGLASGSTFPIGTTTVTYEVADASNNTIQCSFDVIVSGLAPSIVCPSSITQNSDVAVCGANVTFSANETVGIPASTITYSHTPGSFFPIGTTIVTATATNAVGTSTCTFDIKVEDKEAPAISCLADKTVNNTSGICGAVLSIDAPTVTDNCSVLQLGNGLNFDGVDDIAFVLSSSSINTQNHNKRTAEVYFRVIDKNINTRKQVIWEEGGMFNGLNIYVYDGKLYMGVYCAGTGLGPQGNWIHTSAIQSGQWHNAVLVFDGTQTAGQRLKGYLDGNLFATASTPRNVINAHPAKNAVGAM
ncbi:MAG: HYR domain-containing protein, partial [Candidatus Cloacimonetes bacterium]|nr:HYR domain-containing protein [Candidatus Cloacimonadota bacterium]